MNGWRIAARRAAWAAVALSTLALGSCSGSVGVGMSVGVPVGNHGYMSVGAGRWL